MPSSKLIFVYANDSGAINTLIHIAHKMISPKTYSCNLCGLTYNIVTEKAEWTQFLKNVQISTEFLHRDEFKKKYPKISSRLPAIFVVKENALTVLMDADEINLCKETAALILAIQNKLTNEHAVKHQI